MKKSSHQMLNPIIFLVILLSIIGWLPTLAVATQYTYTAIDYPGGSVFTGPRGINNAGYIVGMYQDAGFASHGFLFDGSTYTSLNQYFPWGINNAGDMVGFYGQSGFLYDGSTYTPLNHPGAQTTYAYGINSSGRVVGQVYFGNDNSWRSFLYDGSTYTPLNYPGALDTMAYGINDRGQIVGQAVLSSWLSFMYDGSTYTLVYYPLGYVDSTRAYDINNAGHVVGMYIDNGGAIHGFMYDGSTYTFLDYPGAKNTEAFGINDVGQIVGVYMDSNGREHGFLATPITPNQPPTAICQNVTVSAGSSCTALASIDNGSFDPDGDPITLTQSPAGPYPLGDTSVTLTVTDSKGASSQCTGTVTVVDQAPPVIAMASVNPSVLWPPNHKMVNVTINYNATDNCDQASVCKISGITSNEPISSSDYTIVDAHHVKLTADRLGSGNGRAYTIAITCTDASNNSSSQAVTVSVPHDQGK